MLKRPWEMNGDVGWIDRQDGGEDPEREMTKMRRRGDEG